MPPDRVVRLDGWPGRSCGGTYGPQRPRNWRQKFPTVDVIESSRCGSAAQVLVNAARDASLVVVGRRIRTGSLGVHVGHVTHAALHHIGAPVAVVAHG
ncbi:universal stress protein [Streptomyces sp. NPDC058464]|uniref:universal stress protein n=1 Tax=Streptomyces sp. NPDC058464 TaxID=3346511 RepID=UPI00366762AD